MCGLVLIIYVLMQFVISHDAYNAAKNIFYGIPMLICTRSACSERTYPNEARGILAGTRIVQEGISWLITLIATNNHVMLMQWIFIKSEIIQNPYKFKPVSK